jgi:peptidyl-prolyl cis-trans isomerase A (cyclophilin A)/peptidyl-prolyl cis-trans isomerase B (cyclophilin B)
LTIGYDHRNVDRGDTRLKTMRLASLLLCLCLAPQLGLTQETAQVTTAPRVRVVTNHGNFVIELDHGRAPLTVDAFLKYVNQGFYSGVIFHRVVAGFIAQAGGYAKPADDTTELQPKPVTTSVINESGNGLSNLRGTVGFARNTEPHSGTSQFYINLADNIDLNPRPTRWGYAVFGKVIEGMEVVDDIGHRPTHDRAPFPSNVPVEPIVIERIEVIE